MKKTDLIHILIALIGLAFTAGILQPINQAPTPEPVPHWLCVPEPPAVTCLRRA